MSDTHTGDTHTAGTTSTGDASTEDLAELLDRYTREVYLARDPDAAVRFIADPCLRHEHGELVTMSLADNVARIRRFLDSSPRITFANRVVVSGPEHVVSCFDMTVDDRTLSGIEVFRVVGGRITETWNSTVQPGAWG